MRSVSLIVTLIASAALSASAAEAPQEATADPAQTPAGTPKNAAGAASGTEGGEAPEAPAAPLVDRAEIAKADAQAKAGVAAMQASNSDTSRTVDAALAFSSALRVYEAAGLNDKIREMQANIFWCKKRMNLDDLERFVASKGKDANLAADIARIEAVAEKQIPLEEADSYLAAADTYALENPDQGFLIAVRYFEVAERFAGSPASLKAQRKSLDFQAKATPVTSNNGETLFTRPAKPPQGRQPVPSAADQKTAKDTVRKLFKDDFASRKDSVKRALAWRLFDQAKSSRDDIKMRYALLTEAIQLAVGNRDAAAILTFADELGDGFEGVDATAEKRTQLTKIKTDSTAMAVLKLLDDPRDPSANSVVGKYFCLSADNWSVGLPLLALGGDQTLAKIASMELTNPSAAPQQMELADAWHAQGGSRSEQQIAAWNRAAMWYRKALPSLTGVSKERVEQTLEALFPTVIPPDFKWEAITDKQWDKLKATPVVVSAVKPKTDSGVVLGAGERARIVPHPSDTWMFNSWWTDGQIAVGWRGEQYKSATGVISIGSSRMVGQLMAWTKEGDQKPPGIISGPGKLILGPNESGYAVKGAIRVKILVLDD